MVRHGKDCRSLALARAAFAAAVFESQAANDIALPADIAVELIWVCELVCRRAERSRMVLRFVPQRL